MEIGPRTIVQSHAVIEGAVRIRRGERDWSRRDHRRPAPGFGFQDGNPKHRWKSATATSFANTSPFIAARPQIPATRLGNDNFLMAGRSSRSQLRDRRQGHHREQLSSRRLRGGRRWRVSRRWLRFSSVHADRTARDYAGNVWVWQRYPALCRGGGREQSGWIEHYRFAARRFHVGGARRDQGRLSSALRKRPECQPGARPGAHPKLERERAVILRFCRERATPRNLLSARRTSRVDAD